MNGPSPVDAKPGVDQADDYDYIIKIIWYLDLQFGVRFFITPRDFDLLCRWREKRIPLEVIKESLANVVSRRRARTQPITGFANFNYEVKKNFKGFLELTVGEGDRSDSSSEAGDPVEFFFEGFPQALEPLRPVLENLKAQREAGVEELSTEALDEGLLRLFAADGELAMKTAVFLNSLAPSLRNPKIERKYRLNYVKGKFKIPDFEE